MISQPNSDPSPNRPSCRAGIAPRRRGDILAAGFVGLMVLGVLAVAGIVSSGCTVAPKVVTNSQASFDGNKQNSGLLGYDEAGNGIFTSHARDRYNALIDQFGKSFKPPIERDSGIVATSTNTFLLDGQHRFYFETMNRWRIQPPKP